MVQAEIWQQYALLNLDFDFRSVANGIALCPVCQVHFDNSSDPGFVFFPTDLRSFINFEVNDRERRRRRNDRRSVPSAQLYKAHQTNTDTILTPAIGGLYRCVFLKNYLGGGEYPDMTRALAISKPWHGDPLASLRRAFAVLGTPRVYIMDEQIRKGLELLRHLYFAAEKPINPFFCELYPIVRGIVLH